MIDKRMYVILRCCADHQWFQAEPDPLDAIESPTRLLLLFPLGRAWLRFTVASTRSQ